MEKNTSNAVKKVVVIGPESTGKSTLSTLLAKYYDTTWVKEYAREFIDRLSRPYEERDLLEIANGQLQSEDRELKYAKRVLICDTDLLVIKVWSEHKFGACFPEVLEMIKERKYDLYLLTNTDVPWEDDPQREQPHMRELFMNIYREEVIKTGVPCVEIVGSTHFERQRIAVDAIDKLLKN